MPWCIKRAVAHSFLSSLLNRQSLFGTSAGFVAATGMLDLNATGCTGARSLGGFMAAVLYTGWALGAA